MKSKIIPLTIFILLPLSAFAGKDFGCIDGQIRFIEGKSEKIIKEKYCYDALLRKIYSSGQCRPNTKCMADFDRPIVLKLADVSGETGSPGFKICEKINGVPQIMEFWDGDRWIKTARCVFKDGSYTDTGSLSSKVEYSDVVKKEEEKRPLKR